MLRSQARDRRSVDFGETALSESVTFADSDLCICGHSFGQHNGCVPDRCVFRVTVGLDTDGLPYPDPDEAPNPISRICDLCPPSGFTMTGYQDSIYGATWPKEDLLTGYGERELWTPTESVE